MKIKINEKIKYFIFLIILLFLIFNQYKILNKLNKKEKLFFPRENEKILIDFKKIDEKIEKLNTELNFFEENPKIMVELGIYYFLKGPDFYDKAINLLYKAWQLGSLDVRIFYYLGVMYEFLNLYNLAINEYKKFLNNFPEDLEVNIRMGNIYYKTNKVDDALNIYLYVLKKDENNIIALSNIGFIYFSRNELDEAYNYLLKVKNICKIKNFIEPRNINFYLGNINFYKKKFEIAKNFFETEKKLYPDNLENTLMLAKTYYELNDVENTSILVKKLEKLIPKDKNLIDLQKKLKKLT